MCHSECPQLCALNKFICQQKQGQMATFLERLMSSSLDLMSATVIENIKHGHECVITDNFLSQDNGILLPVH